MWSKKSRGAEYCALWDAWYDRGASWTGAIHHYGLGTSFQEAGDPGMDVTSDTVMLELVEELIMGDGIKCFGEVQNGDIDLCLPVPIYQEVLKRGE